MIDVHTLLIGGGHSHVEVLRDWIEKGPPAPTSALLTPERYLRYSGMVPGWISGAYDMDEGRVDLAALARVAGVQLIHSSCLAVDPEGRTASYGENEQIKFKFASINTGGVGHAHETLGAHANLVDIRPISAFIERMGDFTSAERAAVIGGGAGGVELAFALRNWAEQHLRPDVALITGKQGLLPEMSKAVRRKVDSALRDQNILMFMEDAHIEDGAFFVGDQSIETPDLIVAALGSAAPRWPKESGLAVDQAGYIAVDQYQRSLSHPHILAVADVAARGDLVVPHSGVHAVFAGPVLAANLRDVVVGREPARVYRPRWNHLYLMSTGDGRAVASYGPFAAHARWVWHLKDWIDKRWIAKYALAPDDV